MRIIASISLLLLVAIATYSQDATHQQPEVLTAVAPTFPPILVAANISGRSTLEVTVDSKVEVTSTKIIEGHPLINQMTRLFDETLSKWRFSTTNEKGKRRTARIAFCLHYCS